MQMVEISCFGILIGWMTKTQGRARRVVANLLDRVLGQQTMEAFRALNRVIE